MKVLLSAYNCDPRLGSEWGMSWNWAQQLSRFFEVWILSTPEGQSAIEEELSRKPNARLRPVFVTPPLQPISTNIAGHKRWVRLAYHVWQLKALTVARKLHKQHRFAFVQHLSWASLFHCGFLWSLPIPFVLGPIGGGETTPSHFLKLFGRWQVIEKGRSALVALSRLNPLLRIAIHRSALALATNADTETVLERLGAKRIGSLIQYGAHPGSVSLNHKPAGNPCQTVLWVGRLDPRKGPILAIKSFALVVQTGINVRLVMVGDGPLKHSCKRLAKKLGLDGHVHFQGYIPHSSVLQYYANSDIFLFTSLRDTLGTVVVDAMSHGLPVVTLDHQGVSQIVTDDCGIKVSVVEPAQVERDLSDGLIRLLHSQDLKHKLGRNAQNRILNNFSWDCLGNQMKSYYECLTAENRPAE